MVATRFIPVLSVLFLLGVVARVDAQAIFYSGFEFDPPPLLINEVEANDDVGLAADWVEFHNATSQPVDLSDWYFTDDDPTHVKIFPAGTVVAAGGYLVIEPTDFALGSGGDSIALYSPLQERVDLFQWNAPTPPTTTHARCPNASGAFAFTPPTRAAANACP